MDNYPPNELTGLSILTSAENYFFAKTYSAEDLDNPAVELLRERQHAVRTHIARVIGAELW